MDADGLERHRIEGFLPVNDFLGQLHLGLGMVEFQKQSFSAAEQWFRSVYENFPDSSAAPEAMYWAGVSRYKGSNDPEALKNAGEMLKQKYPQTEWARKGSVWLPQPANAS